MPPTDRFVISFAAEPPQQALPYGRWAEELREHFVAACADIDAEGEEIGEPGDIRWFPDRTSRGRTYVPAVARTEIGYELFGYVSYVDAGDEAGPDALRGSRRLHRRRRRGQRRLAARSERDGALTWRGEGGNLAEMTLVWGVPLIPGGALVTAELADHAVDQCELNEQRFTMIAPDNYRGDFLDVKLWSGRGDRLAVESLYVEDEDDDDDPDAEPARLAPPAAATATLSARPRSSMDRARAS